MTSWHADPKQRQRKRNCQAYLKREWASAREDKSVLPYITALYGHPEPAVAQDKVRNFIQEMGEPIGEIRDAITNAVLHPSSDAIVPSTAISVPDLSNIRTKPPGDDVGNRLWADLTSSNVSMHDNIFTNRDLKRLAQVASCFIHQSVKHACTATKGPLAPQPVVTILDKQIQYDISQILGVLLANQHTKQLTKAIAKADAHCTLTCQLTLIGVCQYMMARFEDMDRMHLRPATAAMWNGTSVLMDGRKLLVNHAEGTGQQIHTDNWYPYMVQSLQLGINHDPAGVPVPSDRVPSTRICVMGHNCFRHADSALPHYKACYGQRWSQLPLVLYPIVKNGASVVFPATVPHYGPPASPTTCSIRMTLFQQRRPPGLGAECDAVVFGEETQGYEPDYLTDGILDVNEPSHRARVRDIINSHPGYLRKYHKDRKKFFQEWMKE